MEEELISDLNGDINELEPTNSIVKCEVDLENYEVTGEATDEENWDPPAKYVCDVCNKGFRYVGWLVRHKLSVDCSSIAPSDPSVMAIDKVTKTYSRHSRSVEDGIDDLVDEESQEKPNELLCCPNDPCEFQTYWHQSLLKHCNYHCRFRSNQEISVPDNKNETGFALGEMPSACPICSKTYSNVHEHIEHMSEVHQMRASFRCSTCGETFPSKYEVEDHLRIHTQEDVGFDSSLMFARDGEDVAQEFVIDGCQINDDLDVAEVDVEEDNDSNGGLLLDEVFNCICGKAYLLKSSYEQHLKVCPKKQPEKEVETPNDVTAHCRRDLVERVHCDGDLACKCCGKEFKSLLCIHNHLCRLRSCREHYCRNLLPPFIDECDKARKNNPRKRRSSLQTPEEKNAMETKKMSTSNNNTNNDTEKSSPLNEGAETGGSNEPLADSIEASLYLTKDPIQCIRCMKVFCGESPGVEFNEHIKTSKACAPPANRLNYLNRILLHSRKVFVSPGSTSGAKTPDFLRSLSKEPKNDPVKYFCKLCPEREIKNRVTLGTHLTQYHGLPPVNINTPEGPAQRCQTCCQTFHSKYFYNMHRYDCDSTSIYIGILTPEEEKALIKKKSRKTATRSVNRLLRTPRSSILEQQLTEDANHNPVPEQRMASEEIRGQSGSSYFSNSYKCSLCGKAGFWGPNAVKMHQKYQCVNRSLLQYAKPMHYNSTTKTRCHQRPLAQRIDRYMSISTGRSSKYGQSKKDDKETYSEIARMNNLAKHDVSITMCDACGKGPYNSYYYLLEHKRQFCRVLKGPKGNRTVPSVSYKYKCDKTADKKQNIAKKSMPYSDSTPQVARKSFPNSNDKPHDVVEAQETDEPIVEEISKDSLEFDKIPKCSHCEFETSNFVQFIRHRFEHIRDDIESQKPSDGYFCEICKGKFISSQYQRMQQHLIYHLQTFNAIRQKNLADVKKNSRLEIEYEDDSVLACPYCKVSFGSRTSLANHIKSSCPSRYQCNKCQRTYLTKKSLLEHKAICKGELNTSDRSFYCCHCGVRFRLKEKLIYHQQVCLKVYNADISSRIEKLIEIASTCSICGMVAKNYIAKSKHEMKCLERALSDLGHKLPNIEDKDLRNSDLEFVFESNSWDVSSLESSVEVNTSKVSIQLDEHGIEKDVRISLKRLEDEMMDKHRAQTDINVEESENKLKRLKEQFTSLIRRLVKDEEVLEEIMRGDSVEDSLIEMLKHMGEEPEIGRLDELTRFRLNLQIFLRLSIEAETLEKAYHNAESVDEVVHNLLTFPYKLK